MLVLLIRQTDNANYRSTQYIIHGVKTKNSESQFFFHAEANTLS